MSQTPNSPTRSSRPLPRIPVQVDQEDDVEVLEDLDRGQSGKKVAKKGRCPSLRLLKKGKLRNMHPDLRGKEFL
jgi:hypothetical protein